MHIFGYLVTIFEKFAIIFIWKLVYRTSKQVLRNLGPLIIYGNRGFTMILLKKWKKKNLKQENRKRRAGYPREGALKPILGVFYGATGNRLLRRTVNELTHNAALRKANRALLAKIVKELPRKGMGD